MTRPTILLADDSQTALMVERLLLTGGGYDVVVARDGREAVERAAAASPSLIILDVVMPRLGGIDACRQIRASDSGRDVPIIMVTTRAEGSHVEDAFEAGCSDYVVKPVKGPELLAKVRSLLGGPVAGDE